MFDKVFELLISSDENPKAQRRWRMTVAIVLLTLLVFSMWAANIFDRVMPGFAYTAEVDKHIEKAVTPLHDEQLKNAAKLDSLSDQVKDSLAETKASEIRGLAVKRCKERNGEERENLNREIDRKQSEYFKLVSRYYAIPDCNSL